MGQQLSLSHSTKRNNSLSLSYSTKRNNSLSLIPPNEIILSLSLSLSFSLIPSNEIILSCAWREATRGGKPFLHSAPSVEHRVSVKLTECPASIARFRARIRDSLAPLRPCSSNRETRRVLVVPHLETCFDISRIR